MPTIVELHLLSFFITNFFMLLSCKILLKKSVKLWAIILCALMLAAIKLVMDLLCTNLFVQIAVIILCAECLMIFLFKVNHISRLLAYLAIFLTFYGGIFALQTVLLVVINHKGINYISNYYLLCQIGFDFIVFAFVQLFAEYKHIVLTENLVKTCTITINRKKISFSGFVDTGNQLIEPKTHLGIVVVNFDAIKKQIDKQIYADIVLSTNSSGKLNNIGRFKYSTIAGTNYLTIFRPEQFCVDAKPLDCFVGISVTNQIQNYDALLGANCI